MTTPAVEILPAVAFKLKVFPTVLPELLALRVMVPAAISCKATAPVEVALTVVALIVFAPAKVMPALPALRLMVGAFSAPAAVIPLAAAEAFKLKEVPELPFKVIAPFAVSSSATAPVEPTVRVVALVEPGPLIVTPPVPEETVRLEVVSVLVDETAPAAPGVAVRLIELAAFRPAVKVTFPAVELSEMLFAVILAPIEAVLIVLAATRLT